MSSDEKVSLPSLYSGALSALSNAFNLPPNSVEKAVCSIHSTLSFAYNLSHLKGLVISSLSTLKKVHSRIVELSLFSPNETVEDITTRDLIYLTLPFVLAEAQSRQQLDTQPERLESLTQTQVRSYSHPSVRGTS